MGTGFGCTITLTGSPTFFEVPDYVVKPYNGKRYGTSTVGTGITKFNKSGLKKAFDMFERIDKPSLYTSTSLLTRLTRLYSYISAHTFMSYQEKTEMYNIENTLDARKIERAERPGDDAIIADSKGSVSECNGKCSNCRDGDYTNCLWNTKRSYND